eukprot:GHVH01009937.1.p1 GENE.GHVH01009937.1~~GHVH01009937.1.p1  ORF type:complete len:1370 (+),score=217.48 GHVH01009937.1:28-4137(+)
MATSWNLTGATRVVWTHNYHEAPTYKGLSPKPTWLSVLKSQTREMGLCPICALWGIESVCSTKCTLQAVEDLIRMTDSDAFDVYLIKHEDTEEISWRGNFSILALLFFRRGHAAVDSVDIIIHQPTASWNAFFRIVRSCCHANIQTAKQEYSSTRARIMNDIILRAFPTGHHLLHSILDDTHRYGLCGAIYCTEHCLPPFPVIADRLKQSEGRAVFAETSHIIKSVMTSHVRSSRECDLEMESGLFDLNHRCSDRVLAYLDDCGLSVATRTFPHLAAYCDGLAPSVDDSSGPRGSVNKKIRTRYQDQQTDWKQKCDIASRADNPLSLDGLLSRPRLCPHQRDSMRLMRKAIRDGPLVAQNFYLKLRRLEDSFISTPLSHWVDVPLYSFITENTPVMSILTRQGKVVHYESTYRQIENFVDKMCHSNELDYFDDYHSLSKAPVSRAPLSVYISVHEDRPYIAFASIDETLPPPSSARGVGGIFCDEPGLGKTLSLIAHLSKPAPHPLREDGSLLPHTVDPRGAVVWQSGGLTCYTSSLTFNSESGNCLISLTSPPFVHHFGQRPCSHSPALEKITQFRKYALDGALFYQKELDQFISNRSLIRKSTRDPMESFDSTLRGDSREMQHIAIAHEIRIIEEEEKRSRLLEEVIGAPVVSIPPLEYHSRPLSAPRGFVRLTAQSRSEQLELAHHLRQHLPKSGYICSKGSLIVVPSPLLDHWINEVLKWMGHCSVGRIGSHWRRQDDESIAPDIVIVSEPRPPGEPVDSNHLYRNLVKIANAKIVISTFLCLSSWDSLRKDEVKVASRTSPSSTQKRITRSMVRSKEYSLMPTTERPIEGSMSPLTEGVASKKRRVMFEELTTHDIISQLMDPSSGPLEDSASSPCEDYKYSPNSGDSSQRLFRAIHWKNIFVDEGHQLSGSTKVCGSILESLRSDGLWIVSGTPLWRIGSRENRDEYEQLRSLLSLTGNELARGLEGKSSHGWFPRVLIAALKRQDPWAYSVVLRELVSRYICHTKASLALLPPIIGPIQVSLVPSHSECRSFNHIVGLQLRNLLESRYSHQSPNSLLFPNNRRLAEDAIFNLQYAPLINAQQSITIQMKYIISTMKLLMLCGASLPYKKTYNHIEYPFCHRRLSFIYQTVKSLASNEFSFATLCDLCGGIVRYLHLFPCRQLHIVCQACLLSSHFGDNPVLPPIRAKSTPLIPPLPPLLGRPDVLPEYLTKSLPEFDACLVCCDPIHSDFTTSIQFPFQSVDLPPSDGLFGVLKQQNARNRNDNAPLDADQIMNLCDKYLTTKRRLQNNDPKDFVRNHNRNHWRIVREERPFQCLSELKEILVESDKTKCDVVQKLSKDTSLFDTLFGNQASGFFLQSIHLL